MKLDRVRLFPNIQEFSLCDLGLPLGDHFLRTLPGWANGFPDPLTFECEVDIKIFTSLVDCHSTHLLS